jgi:hypothetical protein
MLQVWVTHQRTRFRSRPDANALVADIADHGERGPVSSTQTPKQRVVRVLGVEEKGPRASTMAMPTVTYGIESP